MQHSITCLFTPHRTPMAVVANKQKVDELKKAFHADPMAVDLLQLLGPQAVYFFGDASAVGGG